MTPCLKKHSRVIVCVFLSRVSVAVEVFNDEKRHVAAVLVKAQDTVDALKCSVDGTRSCNDWREGEQRAAGQRGGKVSLARGRVKLLDAGSSRRLAVVGDDVDDVAGNVIYDSIGNIVGDVVGNVVGNVVSGVVRDVVGDVVAAAVVGDVVDDVVADVVFIVADVEIESFMAVGMSRLIVATHRCFLE